MLTTTRIGELLRSYRTRLGLTQFELANRCAPTTSSYVNMIENGWRPIGRLSIALRVARALELDPYETDHFLYVAGFAPRLDWQHVTRDLLAELGFDETGFENLIYPYYQALLGVTIPEEDADDVRAPASSP